MPLGRTLEPDRYLTLVSLAGTGGGTGRGERMTLRVGIIGVGWGAHVQVPGFRAAKGFEPVALCARTPDRLERVATKPGIDQPSTDWPSFVPRDDLDVISVATPTVLPHEMTIAALAAGKPVLCEKPLAGGVEAGRPIVGVGARSQPAPPL